jgi:hypothetical protein
VKKGNRDPIYLKYFYPDFIKALEDLDGEFPGADLDDPSLINYVQKVKYRHMLKIKILKNIALFLIAPLFVFGTLFLTAKLIRTEIIFDLHFFIHTVLVSFTPSILLFCCLHRDELT